MEELLPKVPIFACLKKREISFLAKIARRVDYPAGMVLFCEGEIGDRLYLIIDGQLEIIKDYGGPNERLIRLCGAGEHVGEISFLDPEGKRSATVRTRTAVRLIEITREHFELLLARKPAVAYGIAQAITQRMLDSESKLFGIIAEKDRQLASARKGAEPGAPDPRPGVETPAGKSPEDKVIGHGIHRISIKTFGNFQVLRGETLIGDREWRAKQPKLLLKAIIARGGTGIPKDALIEDLWPEAAPDSGEANFKVVLHRLRKTLGPDMGKAASSSYVVLKDNLVFLKKDYCHTDLDEFLAHLQKGKKAEDAGDTHGAVAHNRSAIDLYVGDFLSEDLYAPWAETKRNELRTMYLDVLSRTAELYQVQGSSKKAAECYKLMIKADSTGEAAYRKLMLIYSNRGSRASALKVYEECRKALENELGVEPGALTVSIYRKILDGQ